MSEGNADGGAATTGNGAASGAEVDAALLDASKAKLVDDIKRMGMPEFIRLAEQMAQTQNGATPAQPAAKAARERTPDAEPAPTRARPKGYRRAPAALPVWSPEIAAKEGEPTLHVWLLDAFEPPGEVPVVLARTMEPATCVMTDGSVREVEKLTTVLLRAGRALSSLVREAKIGKAGRKGDEPGCPLYFIRYLGTFPCEGRFEAAYDVCFAPDERDDALPRHFDREAVTGDRVRRRRDEDDDRRDRGARRRDRDDRDRDRAEAR
jgi:hypothetical protein